MFRNCERAAEDAWQRDDIVQEVQEKIAAGGVWDQLKNGVRRYLSLTSAAFEIDLTKVQEDARFDGKRVLRTATSLPPEHVALANRGEGREGVSHAQDGARTTLRRSAILDDANQAGVVDAPQICNHYPCHRQS